MYSLQLRLRSVFCLHTTSSRSYKKIHKIDHFNEFGKVLSKDVLKQRKKTFINSNRYKKTQLDHLSEFGPVLTADSLKKERKIIIKTKWVLDQTSNLNLWVKLNQLRWG